MIAILDEQVYQARRVATMKLVDDGFEDKENERKAQKQKMLEEKGLLKGKNKKRKKGGKGGHH